MGMLLPLVELGRAISICAVYVASMYAVTRDNSRRNDADVMLQRLVTSSAFSAVLGAWPLISKLDYTSSPVPSTPALFSVSALRKFFSASPSGASARATFCSDVLVRNSGPVAKLILTLFAGVLLEWALYLAAKLKKRLREHTQQQPQQRVSSFPPPFRILRDFIVAPIAEEVVFRGAIQQCCLSDQSFGGAARVALSAVIFSAAHLHHAVVVVNSPTTSPSAASGSPRVSFSSSSLSFEASRALPFAVPSLLFGLVGGAFVERLGAGLVPVAAAHGFCNLVGPPRIVLDDLVFEEFPLLRSVPPNIMNYFFIATHITCVGFFVKGLM